jgi:hypothetical protein
MAALFLHTPLDAPALLARAAAQTRVGERCSASATTRCHAGTPTTSRVPPSAREVAAALGVQEPEWRIVVAEELPRRQAGQDGRGQHSAGRGATGLTAADGGEDELRLAGGVGPGGDRGG